MVFCILFFSISFANVSLTAYVYQINVNDGIDFNNQILDLQNVSNQSGFVSGSTKNSINSNNLSNLNSLSISHNSEGDLSEVNDVITCPVIKIQEDESILYFDGCSNNFYNSTNVIPNGLIENEEAITLGSITLMNPNNHNNPVNINDILVYSMNEHRTFLEIISDGIHQTILQNYDGFLFDNLEFQSIEATNLYIQAINEIINNPLLGQ